MSHGDQPNVMSDGVDATLVAPAGLIYHIIDLASHQCSSLIQSLMLNATRPIFCQAGLGLAVIFFVEPKKKEDTAIFISIRPEQRPSLFDHYLILSN
jgi:hypothetical protein